MSDAESIDRGWGAAAADGTTVPAGLWQVNTRGRKVIAMTERELAASYKSGKLTARSLVWGDGMAEWTPLGDIAQLAKLLRDSEPPPSGTRPRLDELTSGTHAYGTSAEVTTNTGGLAVYERPLALIEFPDVIEPAEPADEPTPSFATPTATPSAKARATVNAPLPKPAAPAAQKSARATKSTPFAAGSAPKTGEAPPAPPLPSVRATLPGPLFPSPVMASPLAAALTAAAPPASPTPPAVASIAAPPLAATPAAPPALPPEVPAPVLPPAFFEAASLVRPPRPAIEFLPPIIVHEKEEDDGASGILELPLHGALHDAPFSESTLVLSGRRRSRRWVPVNAAVALCIGAACLASALTALVVRGRPAPPARIVEKLVTVPAAPVAAAAPAPIRAETPPAPAPTVATAEAKTPVPAEPALRPTAERSSAKTDASPTRNKDWRQDPGALGEEAKPRREARAGFPTSPGF